MTDPMILLDRAFELLNKLRKEYPEVHRVEVGIGENVPTYIVCFDPDEGDEYTGLMKLQRFPKEWHGHKVTLSKQRADGTPYEKKKALT